MKRTQLTNQKGWWNLDLVETPHRGSNHVLVILQTVASQDIETGKLLSNEIMPSFQASLKLAREFARRYGDHEPVTVSVCTFNQFKHLHESPEKQARANAVFAKHVQRVIAKVNPDKVLICGDTAFEHLHRGVEHYQLKRGWIQHLQYEDRKTRPTTLTLDFMRLLENDGQLGNLLGFWCWHMANLIYGSVPYSIGQLEPRARLVDNEAKFQKLCDLLRKTKRVAVDTETAGLQVYDNKIYTIQFTFEEEPNWSYIVPLRHPTTPLTIAQQKAWSRTLQAFFKGNRKFMGKPYKGAKLHPEHGLNFVCEPDELPELVFFNGSFDLRIIRTCLRIEAYIPHHVYEIRAGEHDLDENAPDLKAFGTKSGGLAYVTAYYGCTYYQDAPMSKEDTRTNIGNMSLKDPNLLNYVAMDTISLIAIRKGQLIRAGHQQIADRNYKPYFLRHMRYVMGPTENQLSRLRECGSAVDIEYLKHLAGIKSPLLSEIKRFDEELFATKEIKQANQNLLDKAGYKSQGLWGQQPHVFAWSKGAHKSELFLNVLGLQAVNMTKTGQPAIDKALIERYRNEVQLVSDYADRQELDKLHGTYIKGWLKRLRTSYDGVRDYHLRPDYSYVGVATGRLASYDPSLQVIPTRGKSAKLVKRAFVTRKGKLLVRFDYSAHEVRMWSIISGDMILAEAFRIGQKLRQIWINKPTDEIKGRIKLEGDLHIANVKRFFGKIIDKSDPLRDAVKAVIFGVIYGKQAFSLGEDTKRPEIAAIYKRIAELKKERDALINGTKHAEAKAGK